MNSKADVTHPLMSKNVEFIIAVAGLENEEILVGTGTVTGMVDGSKDEMMLVRILTDRETYRSNELFDRWEYVPVNNVFLI